MVECTGLENRRGRKAFGGSNPPASAIEFPYILGRSEFISNPGEENIEPDFCERFYRRLGFDERNA